MIVVDTNVLVYLSCPQKDADLARRARRVLVKARQVLLPTLWRHEYLNALATYIQHGELDPALGADLWLRALAAYGPCEAPVDFLGALGLARTLRLSAYDAQFVALAEGANTVLVTEDRRLIRAAGGRAMDMEHYLAQA